MALLASVAVGLVILGAAVLCESREDTWEQATQASENLRLALERDIAHNIGAFDLSLQGVIEALRQPDVDGVSPGLRHLALFATAASAEDHGAILVLDAEGRIVEDSSATPPHPFDLGDFDGFRIHRDHPDAGLVVSRPYRSKIGDGEPSIAFSRRVPTDDGHFAGVVIAGLRLSYFQRLFERLDVGSQGTIALIRDDGHQIARYPYHEGVVDRDLSQRDIFRHIRTSSSGQYLGRSSVDGAERLYTFGRIPGLPLILTISSTTADIYASWWRRALVIGPVLLLLCAGAVGSFLMFHRETSRRSAAEAALRHAADELAMLAATDGLTGIANRRSFDMAFDQAWSCAVRGHRSLSFLLVDIDCFKAFNDHHGHLAGDSALIAVAACLRRQLVHAGDSVARFGGEEFALILPETNLEDALAAAERLRSAVESLDIRHAASPMGRITVSIGVASSRPSGPNLPSHLIEAADAALYAAKAGGRNRVRTREVAARSAPVPKAVSKSSNVTVPA